ncbi:tripartite tricarboxylate transporter permease [Pseudonocardia autotrophica]|uniref:tripartite tricarboxylate transporter permease n=1 Tax=Pseudonocardia autotrophica TaxID=2074 RepID=UPI00105B938F|nr:tripartite tricarboxylate transporter permease [Pseudonocardia autotrophica]
MPEAYAMLTGQEPSGTGWEAYTAITATQTNLLRTYWMHGDAPEAARTAAADAAAAVAADPAFLEEAATLLAADPEPLVGAELEASVGQIQDLSPRPCSGSRITWTPGGRTMLVSALEALQVLLSPQHLLWTATGVALGVMLGIIPGLSGLTGMAVLLPLVVGLEPASAIALLIGLMAATTIGDTFPSILMGVPGTAASQATVVDGYPMARQGLGRFALGASFMANLLGGVLGAMTLFLLIPLAGR